jgi:NAD(P)-dependent dehydrogenase (short-subunit alcohol dehydrogenase family)
MWGPSVELYVRMASEGRGVDADMITREIVDRIPTGRIPTDAEVAGTIVYLVSELSSAVTGQAIDANGGEHFA